MVTEPQHLILFWIFVAFFLVIGVVALLAIVGVIRTDNQFRKWAVGVFAAGIAGVVFVWAKSELPLDFFVNLEPPAEVVAENFELVSGKYEYYEPSNADKSISSSGFVELTAGQQMGWWTAKFPYKGMTKAVKLELKDKNGNSWRVRPFYPNYNRQLLMPLQASLKDSKSSLPFAIVANNAFAAEREIKFNNYAKPLRTQYGKAYYQWRVFVDEPSVAFLK